MGEAKVMLMVIGIAVGVIALLVGILVPLSFAELEYYEIGFLRKKSTGEVDTARVYEGGKYFVGPNFDFKVYSGSAHHVLLNDVTVFTSDRLEVRLDVSFQYFLRKEDLALIHLRYDLGYEKIVKINAIDAIKGQGASFSTRQYIGERIAVETAMLKAVRERLGGTCCAADCGSSEFACPRGCIRHNVCTTVNKGLFVDVHFFQLGQIQLSRDITSRYLRALTLQEDVTREMFLQEVQIVRKQTDTQVKQIQNGAQEIRQRATDRSKLIETEARGNYTVTVEKARSQALKSLYRRLGVTDQKVKNSLDYLLTLRGMDNAHLTVDLKQMVVGNMGSA